MGAVALLRQSLYDASWYGEAWNAFIRRAKRAEGEVLLLLTGRDDELAKSKKEREA